MLLRKLAGQTAVYGISSIVARLLNYLLAPYLTRILGTGEYGVIGDMYSIIPFALVVLTLGMETGFFRFAGKAGSPVQVRRIFSTAWGAVSLAALVFLGTVLLLRHDIAAAMHYAGHPSYVTVVACIIALDVIAAVPFARLRYENRAARFVTVRVASVLVNVLLCLFFYSVLPRIASSGGWLGAVYDPAYGPGYAFIANLAGSLLTLFLLYPAFRDAPPRISPRLFRALFLYSFPLLLSGITGTANDFIDRQLIKYILPSDISLSALGIYSAVARTAGLIVIFTQTYRYAAEPFFLSDVRKEDFRTANAVAMKYFVIVSAFLFLFIGLYTDLFAYLLGRSFRGGMHIMPVILAANVLAGILFNLSFWYKYAEQTRYAFYVTFLGLIVTVVLNLALLPGMGYAGSAWARLGCNAAMVVFSYYLNQKHYPVPYDLRSVFLYLGLGGGLYAVGTLAPLPGLFLTYAFRFVLIVIFVVWAVRREKIDLPALFRNRRTRL